MQAGMRIGGYRILAPIGAGGMGEVWRAEDEKLGREVALKVLPEEFATDPDRMARFEREAKVLASLNHPNIAHLYGLESAVPSGAREAESIVSAAGSGTKSETAGGTPAHGEMPEAETSARAEPLPDDAEA